MEPQTQVERTWTLSETRALLDLMRDTGVIRTGRQDWEGLRVLLGSCNIQVSSAEVGSHWRALEGDFFRLRRLLDMGLMPLSAITVRFPFFEEMDQLLTPEIRSCKREADSSGLEEQDFPSSSLSDHKHQASSSTQEADEGAGLVRETSLQDVPGDAGDMGGPDIQRLVVMLCRTALQLMDVVESLSAVQEQLSFQLGYMTHQPYTVPSERRRSLDPAHNLRSRVLRRSLRHWLRYHP